MFFFITASLIFLYFCKDTVFSHGAKKRAKQSGGSIPQPKTSERDEGEEEGGAI